MLKRILTVLSVVLIASFVLTGCTSSETAKKSPLTKESALVAIKKLNPEVEVISVGPGPLDGIWEVVVKRGTTMSIAYMDADAKFLFLGNVVNTDDKLSVTEQRLDELLKIDPKELPVEGSILLGKADAPAMVYVFSDPECPYCALLHTEMLEAVEKNEKVAFRIVLVPFIKQHPSAYGKSKAIMCADTNEASLKMLEDAYTNTEIPAPNCDNQIVETNLEFLDRFSISGTPTIVFPDGSRFQGAIHADELTEAALTTAGISKADKPEESATPDKSN
jgi:thiol:disulfide interchange protein DsbC